VLRPRVGSAPGLKASGVSPRHTGGRASSSRDGFIRPMGGIDSQRTGNEGKIVAFELLAGKGTAGLNEGGGRPQDRACRRRGCRAGTAAAAHSAPGIPERGGDDEAVQGLRGRDEAASADLAIQKRSSADLRSAAWNPSQARSADWGIASGPSGRPLGREISSMHPPSGCTVSGARIPHRVTRPWRRPMALGRRCATPASG
jgi:hypothetical protein